MKPRAAYPARRPSFAACAILALVGVAPRVAGAAPSVPTNPYVAASRASGVPLALIAAIAGVESDYHPWALDIHGHEVYCRNRTEAEQILANAPADVDIGLMQINYRFWGPRLAVSKQQLLDPRNNLLYGALILKRCLNRGGDIWRRISDYHSGSASVRDRYNRRVYAKYLRYLRGAPH